MSTTNNDTKYSLQLQEGSDDIKGDTDDDDDSSIEEFVDALEYLDDIDATSTSKREKENEVNCANKTDLNTLSVEKFQTFAKVADSSHGAVKTSAKTDGNEINNTLTYDDIEVTSSMEELELSEGSTRKVESNVVVVAIDFGTTYSGWAFSLRDKMKDNKLDIQTNNGWQSGDGLNTPKVPTCILFDENEVFHSFGYKAEDMYADLIDNNNGKDWKYFSRFKMDLFCDEDGTNASVMASNLGIRRIRSNFQIKDAQGRGMSAMKVFAESLKYLKEDFCQTLNLRIPSIPLHYISWVLTVPAIWTDKAKQFMRLAALEAGIPGIQLILAYEPEAAAIYCRESTYQRKGQLIGPISALSTEESILVLDCGGGTVDVTAYEILKNGRLKELHEPTGGPWGGTMVDQAFMEFMEDVFGTAVWTNFKNENMSDVLEIQRQFEMKKRTIGENIERKDIILRLTRDVFSMFEAFHGTDFTSKNGVRRYKEKLKVPNEKIELLFEKTTNAIANHIHTLLQKRSLSRIKTILMVGGYSDSAMLRNKLINQFSNITVVCPEDAVLSVVKGAVIFGTIPDLIQERICPRTYGISCNLPFDSKSHSTALLHYYDNTAFCCDIFKVLVRKGDTVVIGKTDFKTIFHPTRELDTKATVGIYSSPELDPMYTFGANVQKLGILELDIPDLRKGGKREIIVSLIFKSTELTVVAKEGNRKVSQKFNCLGSND